MKTITITLASLFLSALSFGQIAHDVEFYSEGGEKFTVKMNGRVLNEEPADRIEIRNIHYDYVQLVIDFEDESITDIEKKIFSLSSSLAEDRNKPMITVAKFIEKKGKYKIKYVSMSAKKIQQDTIIINQETQTSQESNGIQISNGKVVINW